MIDGVGVPAHSHTVCLISPDVIGADLVQPLSSEESSQRREVRPLLTHCLGQHMYRPFGEEPVSGFGTEVCLRCGRCLYLKNSTHLCRQCIRRWGLVTLKKRVKTLRAYHLSICHLE